LNLLNTNFLAEKIVKVKGTLNGYFEVGEKTTVR